MAGPCRVPALRTRGSSALLALALLGLSRWAGAYCRTQTCEFDGRIACDFDRATGCLVGGVSTRWATGCVSYAIQVDGSVRAGIGADEVAEVVGEAFDAWTSVDCGGEQTPAITAIDRGTTACDRVEYSCANVEDNVNVVTFRDGDSLLDDETIALSTVIANLNTGEVLDVDVEINSARFDFYVDPLDARPDAQDLRLVLNHEIGHFLGLSHSDDPQALMWAAYFGTQARPGPDDAEGMCTVFDASSRDPSCDAEPAPNACAGDDDACPITLRTEDSGCACAMPGAGGTERSGPFGVFCGTGLLLTWRLRRARRGARSSGAFLWSSFGADQGPRTSWRR